MDVYFHNTMSGRKERFVPLDPQRITIYACGPTVYNYVHIGNGRPAVVFDVLFRLMSTLYPRVDYVRNFTDIDDKINQAAAELGEPIAELADRYCEAYHQDVEALGVLPPTEEPRATHHIPEIIAMIEQLVAKGHAYEADGHVLFNVPSDPEYGSLSRRTLEDMLEGARVDVAPYKKDAKDFVLWKPSSSEQPGWDSPWGRGRPGWHIECSAMIEKHLGAVIDIHGGGSDLTFPHHENEAAQSRCAHGSNEFARYWLHNGMLTLGAEKMSKSVGNVVIIHELRKKYPGEVLRYVLLSGHYRSPLAWSDEIIKQASASLERLYGALLKAGIQDTATDYADAGASEYPAAVITALCDDLNTPEALAALHGIAGQIHKSEDLQEQRALAETLLAGGWLLGLLTSPAASFFQHGSEMAPAAIEALIAERNQARKDRNFSRADEIRDQLQNSGVELEDTRDGTRWKTASGSGSA